MMVSSFQFDIAFAIDDAGNAGALIGGGTVQESLQDEPGVCIFLKSRMVPSMNGVQHGHVHPCIQTVMMADFGTVMMTTGNGLVPSKAAAFSRRECPDDRHAVVLKRRRAKRSLNIQRARQWVVQFPWRLPR